VAFLSGEFDSTELTIELQPVKLCIWGVDVLANFTTPKFAVRFLAPVPAGSRVRLRVVLAAIEQREGGQVIMRTHNTLELEGAEKPALIAVTLVLLISASGANRQ
jgi:hypothetical protein